MTLSTQAARRLAMFVACVMLPGIGVAESAHTPAPSQPCTLPAGQAGHPNVNATLWMQTAAEYRALALQTYAQAARQLKEALRDPLWSGALENQPASLGLPPAVVLDLDETVLDNSRYQAQDIFKCNTEFNDKTWDAWVARAEAEAIPGALAFVNLARSLGVGVFYVSNRECLRRSPESGPCPQEAETIRNLHRLGFPAAPDRLLLKGERTDWGSEKESRRREIARQYRILMMIGDDLGDFLPNVRQGGTHGNVSARKALVEAHADWWGTRWHMLPNPTYGSWYNILGQSPAAYLRGITPAAGTTTPCCNSKGGDVSVDSPGKTKEK